MNRSFGLVSFFFTCTNENVLNGYEILQHKCCSSFHAEVNLEKMLAKDDNVIDDFAERIPKHDYIFCCYR